MKVSVARKDYECAYPRCSFFNRMIAKEEVYVGFVYSRMNESGRYSPVLLRFHPECSEQNELNRISETKERVKELREKKMRMKIHRPQGRPRKYRDSLEATKLKSLLHYHRKRGNRDKIVELETKLKNLEVYVVRADKAKGGVE